MDCAAISQELVKALRGEATQEQASRELGFTSNVFYPWESGRRAPEASRIFRLGELRGLPIGGRVRAFVEAETQARLRLGTPRGVQWLVKRLLGEASQSHVAERVGVDRTTVGRWVQGKTEPRLPELLELVQVTTQRLLPFVGCFWDPGELDATREAWRDLEAQARLAYDEPFSHAILRALELDGYQRLPRHRDEFLAEQLGMSEEEVRQKLRALEQAGQIAWRGCRYELARVMTVDTRRDPEANKKLKLHWGRVSLERLRGDCFHERALFSYNLFAVPQSTFEQIRKLHLEYYEAVRALVDEAEGADQVVLLNAHLLPLSRHGPPSP